MPFPNEETQFQTGVRQVETARRGGSVRSEKKRFASLLRNSKRAKCGNCKALCMLQNSNPKTLTCPIPEARANAIFYHSPVMDKGILKKAGHQALLKLINKAENPRELRMLIQSVVELLKVEYPEIQKYLHGIGGKLELERKNELVLKDIDELFERKKEEKS